MSAESFNRGLTVRRQVLGQKYVDAALRRDGELDAEFQRFVTEYCWDAIWTDDRLTRRERSLIVLAVTAALGRDAEFRIHLAGALKNGIAPPELLAAIKQISVYAGIPAGVSAMHSLREVLDSSTAD